MTTVSATIKSPFSWFGGKSRIAPLVWQRFGAVRNFVDPFVGSMAALLARPQPFAGSETVNDLDGMVANFWRALKADPDAVAEAADWPVNENDLHARHAWLVGRKADLQARLEGDPKYYDAQAAGWWVWGCCAWIGSGWCSGQGPWQVVEGQLVHLGNAGQGINRKLVHLGDAGRGINRQLVHLGDAGRGINRQLVHLGDAGVGINRQLVEEDEAGTCAEWTEHLQTTMRTLADRLRRVRVCCGDWTRVCGPTPTVKQGLTAVFLDPPYSAAAKRCGDLYSAESLTVAYDVREWCLERGHDPLLRIALCGYAGEGHEALESHGWSVVPWKAKGGYSCQGSAASENCRKERVWFSPHCVPAVEARPCAPLATPRRGARRAAATSPACGPTPKAGRYSATRAGSGPGP